MTKHTVIIGDSRRVKLKRESVHLMVTSPPYFNIKDYGTSDQIGYNDSYEEYITNLDLVWKNCYRALHPGCKICVNIDDTHTPSNSSFGRHKIMPIHTRVIQSCETLGFDYLGSIIWRKISNMGGVLMGSYPFPRNGVLKLDYEFILIFKKLGDPPKIGKIKKMRSKLPLKEWIMYYDCLWEFPGVRQKWHKAMFPIKLPSRLIKMYSFVGDTILDPFLGSGTTMQAARHLERNSIGIELNKKFLPVIRHKVESLFDHSRLKIIDIDKE